MTIINMSGGKAGKPPVYQARTVQPTTFPTTVTPQTGYDALSQVTVNAPANLLAQNIRKDVSIAGVVGTYEAVAPTISLQQKTVTPSASAQIVTPDSGYDGLSRVDVTGNVNLIPSNIKSGVSIFGVTGTYEGQRPNPQTVMDSYSNIASFPMITCGSRLSLDTSPREGYTGAMNTMGSVVTTTYQTGSFACASGASAIYSSAFYSGADGNTCYSAESNRWTNSNAEYSTMTAFLKKFAGYLGEDYFSGTLKCNVGGVVRDSTGYVVESATFSPYGTLGFSTSPTGIWLRNVPFTYSNGRLTVTLTSGALDQCPNYYYFSGAVNSSAGRGSYVDRALFLRSLDVTIE